jgi:NAD+ synthase
MRLEPELAIDPEAESERITAFIAHAVQELGKTGVVLGISGGLDSAVVAHLCVQALGADRVLGLILPERDSDPHALEDARRLATELGIRVEEIDLTPTLAALGAYRPIPQWATRRWLVRVAFRVFKRRKKVSYLVHSLGPPAERPEFSFSSFALPKLRLRMIILYQCASRLGYAVMGTTNRSEWEVGHYDRYGDGACDIDPIRHLFKTQVRALARWLSVPPEIIEKPPSPDLIPGITDELALGMSYEELDSILSLLAQGAGDEEAAVALGVGAKAVAEVRRAREHARRARALPLALGQG